VLIMVILTDHQRVETFNELLIMTELLITLLQMSWKLIRTYSLTDLRSKEKGAGTGEDSPY